MASSPLFDALLTAGALAATITLLGGVYLVILRTPRFHFSLRFLLLTVGSIAVALGLWTAVLRTAAARSRLDPDSEWNGVDPEPVSAPDAPKLLPGINKWNEPMDSPSEPQPIEPR